MVKGGSIYHLITNGAKLTPRFYRFTYEGYIDRIYRWKGPPYKIERTHLTDRESNMIEDGTRYIEMMKSRGLERWPHHTYLRAEIMGGNPPLCYTCGDGHPLWHDFAKRRWEWSLEQDKRMDIAQELRL
jgi:hypothetical protein